MTTPDDLEARLRATLHEHADSVNGSVRPFDPKRVAAVVVDSDDLDLVAMGSTTGRWARGVTVAAAAIVLVVVGVAFVAQRGGTTRDSVQVAADPTSAAGSPSTAPANQVSLDSLNGSFLATSAEANGPTMTNSWISYSSYVMQVATNRCLAAENYQVEPVSAPKPGWIKDNTQFPNVAMFKEGTFGTTAATPPSTTSPPSSPSTTISPATFNAAYSKCQSAAAAPYRSVAAEMNEWNNKWGDLTNGIDADPKVAAARATYVACMAGQGITVTAGRAVGGVEENDAFALADEAMRNGDTTRVAQLAKAHGACVGPVSDAMDAYRLAKRAEFYRDNAEALQKLAIDIDHAETQLSATYDIPRP